MRKTLFPLMAFLLFFACKKETSPDLLSNEIAGAAANRTSPKVTIWHHASTEKWQQISINATAWPAHQAHGDIRQIGDEYQGGKIAYILQSEDPGYDANVPHGLIAAASDQNTDPVRWGCYGTLINGADGTALGTGNQNTIDIMNGCNEPGIAARICGDLNLNGYSDWYLPSKDELNKLYISKEAIGGFIGSGDNFNYWSSSEYNAEIAWFQGFFGFQGGGFKENGVAVRAVRSF